jgi:dynein heavy chain
MTTMIMDGEGELNRVELDFFLKGNTSLDECEACRIPWLAKQNWKDAVKLDSLGGVFEGFLESIVVHKKKWKAWYDEETPEQVPMPAGYSDKLTKFQQLLVCRIFRQDRVINAIKAFILERMGPNYI